MKSIKVIVIGFILAVVLAVWPAGYMQYITAGIGFLLAAVLMAWPATSCKGCSALPTLVATCPSGVAPVKASLTGPLPPKPRAALVFTKARSPLIFDG